MGERLYFPGRMAHVVVVFFWGTVTRQLGTREKKEQFRLSPTQDTRTSQQFKSKHDLSQLQCILSLSLSLPGLGLRVGRTPAPHAYAHLLVLAGFESLSRGFPPVSLAVQPSGSGMVGRPRNQGTMNSQTICFSLPPCQHCTATALKPAKPLTKTSLNTAEKHQTHDAT